MLREQESICNREQMVTTGDRAGPGAQLEISMTCIFIFPSVAIGITASENPDGSEGGALLYLGTSWLDADLVST